MIRDANEIPFESELKADICIVGSGAAGFTLALELDKNGFSVLMLESGTWSEEKATQDLYAGEVENQRLHSPTEKYRQRRFGGSTTIWGGRCMPFDRLDFEQRRGVNSSEWPVPFEAIEPYYAKATELVEAGTCAYRANEAFPEGMPSIIDGFSSDLIDTDSLERFSCPTNFATRYSRRLQVSKNTTVLLRANCTDIKLDRERTGVQWLVTKTLSGNCFKVRATQFVLAVGGLETPRLLLAAKIGNENDVVGRYYMCHMAGNVGEVRFSTRTNAIHHGYYLSKDGIYCRRRFSLRPTEQKRLGVGNAIARLHFPNITNPSHRSGILSGLCMAQRLISYEYGKRLRDAKSLGFQRWLGHARNVLLDPLDTIGFAAHMVRDRVLTERKFPSIILRNRNNIFSLDVHGEQEPNAASRVTISGDRFDALGMPRIKVDWKYAKADIKTVAALLDTLGSEFLRAGVGRLNYMHELLEADLTRFGAYGGHHIGTARMGVDQRSSVVNADCRVHNVDNLYVAGSAVFRTSSQANPTLTIVAMALRLAQHLVANKVKAHEATQARR